MAAPHPAGRCGARARPPLAHRTLPHSVAPLRLDAPPYSHSQLSACACVCPAVLASLTRACSPPRAVRPRDYVPDVARGPAVAVRVEQRAAARDQRLPHVGALHALRLLGAAQRARLLRRQEPGRRRGRLDRPHPARQPRAGDDSAQQWRLWMVAAVVHRRAPARHGLQPLSGRAQLHRDRHATRPAHAAARRQRRLRDPQPRVLRLARRVLRRRLPARGRAAEHAHAPHVLASSVSRHGGAALLDVPRDRHHVRVDVRLARDRDVGAGQMRQRLGAALGDRKVCATFWGA